MKVPAPKLPLEAEAILTPWAMLKVPGPKLAWAELVTEIPPLKL